MTCACHGEDMLSRSDPRYKNGVRWICRIKAREADERKRRRRGVPRLGSDEYLEKVRVAEPAYRTMHHRARKAVANDACSFCGVSGRSEAALRHDGSPSARRLSVAGLAYSVKTEDYFALCRQCHVHYDGVSERVRKQHASKR